MSRKHKILLTILALTLLVFPLITYASAPDVTNEIAKIFEYLNIVLIALQAFLWPILLLTGSLLNNDLLFSGGMQTILLNIWSAVRDFVNIMFVLGLLAIAIANIMGLSGDKVALKVILPKIVIGLIAVNFSFLGCKVVLDVVNVTTTAIFSIPIASDSLAKYGTDANAQASLSAKICDKMVKGQAANPLCAPAKSEGKPGGAKTTKTELTNMGKSFFSSFNSRNAALIMAVELMNIVDIDQVMPANVQSLKSLAINSIFSIIFFIIYAAAFVALFVTMLARVVVLWLAIAISPISALSFAFPKVKESLKDNDPITLFIGHALVPIKVSLVLTIGMIMISQLKSISGTSIASTDPASLGAITSGMSTVQDLIAGLSTAAFIWIAAFMAMEGTKASKFINDNIKGPVEGFAKNVAKLPLYYNFLPVGPKGEKVGLAALTAATSGGPKQFIDTENQRYQKMFGDKKGANLTALESTTSSGPARPLIGQAIMDGNYEPGEDARQKIAAALKKYKSDYKGLNLPSPFGNDVEKFATAIAAGKVSKAQYEYFLNNNKSFKPEPSAPDSIQPTIDAGNKAKTAGVEANKVIPSTTLTAAQTALNAAIVAAEAAEKAKKEPALTKTKTDLETASEKVTNLAAAKTTINQMQLPSTDPRTHLITDATNFTTARTAYTQAFDASGRDATVTKEMLKAKLKTISGISDTQAEALANQIITGNPPATPVTPPPAAPPAGPPAPVTPPPAPAP